MPTPGPTFPPCLPTRTHEGSFFVAAGTLLLFAGVLAVLAVWLLMHGVLPEESSE